MAGDYEFHEHPGGSGPVLVAVPSLRIDQRPLGPAGYSELRGNDDLGLRQLSDRELDQIIFERNDLNRDGLKE